VAAVEVVEVGATDALADAGAKLGGGELAALDLLADGLFMGADHAGDIGDGEALVGW
jgi:hypothetical protein